MVLFVTHFAVVSEHLWYPEVILNKLRKQKLGQIVLHTGDKICSLIANLVFEIKDLLLLLSKLGVSVSALKSSNKRLIK